MAKKLKETDGRTDIRTYGLPLVVAAKRKLFLLVTGFLLGDLYTMSNFHIGRPIKIGRNIWNTQYTHI